MGGKRGTQQERFWWKVDKDGPSGCWEWTAHTQADGYGLFNVVVADGRRTTIEAHRFAYQDLVGPIPAGLQLDHLCLNRRCVNPAHLEPVTPKENVRRSPGHLGKVLRARSHCPRGHPFDEANTYQTGHGRVCRACQRMSDARHREKMRVLVREAR